MRNLFGMFVLACIATWASVLRAEPQAEPELQADAAGLAAGAKLRRLLVQLSRPRLGPAARARIARELGATGSGLAIAPLRRLATDRDSRVARAAIAALGHLPLAAASSALGGIARAKKTATRRRLAAVRALARHRTRRARALLAQIGAGAGPVAAAARKAVAVPCRSCIDAKQLADLSLLLGDAPGPVRAAALERLVRSSSTSLPLDVLLRASGDRSVEVRLEALRALGSRPERGASERLAHVARRGKTAGERRIAAVVRSRRASATRPASQPARRPADDGSDHTPTRDAAVATATSSRPAASATSHPAAAATQNKRPRPTSGDAGTSRPRVATAAPRGRRDGEPAPTDRADAAPSEQKRRADRGGYIPLIAGAATAGSVGLYAITAGAGGDNAWVSLLAGGVLGGGAAALLNLSGEVSWTDAISFATVAGWGGLAGLQAGIASGLDRELAWPVLAGVAAGSAGGLLAVKYGGWSEGDLGWINFAAAEGMASGLGLALVSVPRAPDSTGQHVVRGLTAGLLPAAALAAASLTSHRIELSERDIGLLAYGGVAGGVAGGLLPSALQGDPPGERTGGGVALGQAVGVAAATVATQYSELGARRQIWQWVATGSGGGLGAGLGLLVHPLRGRANFALAEGGIAGGALLGALGGERLTPRTRDLGLAGLATAYGTWSGAWLPSLVFDDSKKRDATARAGGALLGGFGGLLYGGVVSRLFDVHPRRALFGAVGTAGGVMAGGGLGLMVSASERATAAAMQGVSAAGLTAGLALGRKLQLSPSDIGLTALGSAHTAVALALVAPLRRGDEMRGEELAGGLVAGTGIGALAGVAAAQLVELPGADVLELGVWSIGGHVLGGGLGLLVEGSRRTTSALMLGLGSAGLAGGALLAPRMRYSRRDALLITQISAGAMGQGALLADIWRDDASAPVRAGGALVGASAGLLAGAGLAQLVDVRPTSVAEMALHHAGGLSLGAGIGLVAGLSGRDVSRIAQGVGLAGWIGGALRTPYTSYTGRDALLITQIAASGALQGALLPDLWAGEQSPDAAMRAGGALAAAAAGGIAASIWAQYSEVWPGNVGEMALHHGAGLSLGAGIGLAAELDGREISRIAQSVGIAGLVAGALRAPYTEHSGRDALLIAQLTASGAVQGALFPDLWADEQQASGSARGGGALAGGAIGGIAASIWAQHAEIAPADVGEMALHQGAGLSLGGGIGLAAGLDGREVARVAQSVGMAGLIVGALRAPVTRYELRDALEIGLASSYGALLGGFAAIWRHADISEADGRSVAGGLLAGASAGYLAGSFIAPSVELGGGDAVELSVISACSSVLGAGVGLMVPSADDRWPVGLMQSVGLGGTIAGGLLLEHTRYSASDGLMAGLTGTFAAWQGAAIATMAGGSGRQIAGATLAAAGIGGLGSGALAQSIELTQGDVWAIYSGAAWGAIVGASSASVASKSGADFDVGSGLGITAMASDAGLLLSAIAISPALGWSAARVGWINLFGLGGTAVGVAIGAPLPNSAIAAQVGAIAGSVTGLASGVIATHLLGLGRQTPTGASGASTSSATVPTAPHSADSAREVTPPKARTSGPTLASMIADWSPAVLVEPDVDPSTGFARSTATRLLFGLQGTLR